MAMIAPDVTPEPIPGVRLTAPESTTTFGGGPGLEAENQENQKISTEAGDIGTFEKIRADQTAVNDASAKLSATYSDLLTNPQTGVYAAKGINALPAQDQAAQEFKKAANDLSTGLVGPTQIGPFNKKAQAMYSEFTRQTNGHVMQQLDEHQQNSYESLIGNETTRGALAYGDPKTNQSILSNLQAATDQHAQLTGLGPEETQNLKMKVSSNYYENTIDQMLKDPKMAQVAQYYYDQNKDGVTLPARDRIEKALNDGNERAGIQDAMSTILAAHPDSEAEALKAADGRDDVDTQKLRSAISTTFQQNRAAKKNDQDNTFMNAVQTVTQNGGKDPYINKSMIDPATWVKLSPEQQRAIEKVGSVDETSISKWADFRQTIKDGSIAQMSQATFMSKYAPFFKPEDAKQALDQWSSAHKGPNDPKLLRDQTIAQSIDQALTTSGLIHANARQRNDAQGLLLKQVSDDVHHDIIGFEASQKKSPNPQEVQDIVEKRVINTIANKPDSLMTRLGRSLSIGSPTIPFENISDIDKQHVIEMARAAGAVASRENIEKAYTMHKQGKSDDEIKKAIR